MMRRKIGVDDAILLEDFTNPQCFIENLRIRFRQDIIYTYIGNVLVSVNPYKPLSIYDEDQIEEYKGKNQFEEPPHVYAIANAAYQSLLEERNNHCILISGESGSGKTEASKKILHFVAGASGHKSKVEGVKNKLVQSNPVLEAFGNAKTNKNDNSSRFGKYMDIIFSHLGEPIGGDITTYLLEKSRVVSQASGERNFHIFYQLLYGTDDEVLQKLKLSRNVPDYRYIYHKEMDYKDELKDATKYKEMKEAMEIMELTEQEQFHIFEIVAAILHLGNVTFTEDEEDTVTLENSESLENASQLLSCCSSALTNALTHRSIVARNEIVQSTLSKGFAVYARDALSKALYDRLFTYLVCRINKSLQPLSKSKDSVTVMGILDIYGFEVFKKNSFEQFCINYCNEKLQQLFVELTLKSEQEEYFKEGIKWEHITYFDNKVICDLIEQKHKGIISVLDEECLRPGDTSDVTFLDKITSQFSQHNHFISYSNADKDTKKTMNPQEFRLIHYAGGVTYDVEGFLEKNNDLLYRDVTDVLALTKNSILQEIFQKCQNGCKKRPETTITQFKVSLSSLMDILKTKQPSYVRCIKPNDFKLPGIFDADIVNHQVTYLGLMENVRLRRAGFAYRHPLVDFLQKYKSICPSTWPFYKGTIENGVDTLLSYVGYKSGQDYQIGNTKVFIRLPSTLFEVEDLYHKRKHQLITLIKAVWKGYVQRREYLRIRNATIVMQTWTRRYLAQRAARRRRQAANTIRNFIKGYITRGDEPTELNQRFILTAKVQYLLRLARSLPANLSINTWPVAPIVCKEASQLLRRLHRKWLARKYRLALTERQKRQLQLKLLAQSLFKGKKSNYLESVPNKFLEDRLNATQKTLRSTFIKENFENDEKLIYSCPVTKFDRHGYKRRKRILLISDRSVYLVTDDEKSLKMKHRLQFKDILNFHVTTEKDNLLLISISMDLKNEKGDLILEVPHIIECMTWIIDTTNKPEMICLSDVGSISHNMVGEKPKLINIEKADDEPKISRGKDGKLIVVG